MILLQTQTNSSQTNSKSQGLRFHGPVALYLEDYLMYKRVLGMMAQYDLMFDPRLTVDNRDLYFMVQ